MQLENAGMDFPNIQKLARLAGKPVAVLDLEATTGDVSDPAFGIVEAGYLLIPPEGPATQRSFFTDPGFPMNPYAMKITGIREEHYRGKPSFQSFWPELRELLSENLVSGFGILDFDCYAIMAEAEKSRPGFERFEIDCLDARSLWKAFRGTSKGKLEEAAATFGHQMGRAHRALDDAIAAAALLEGFLSEKSPEACLAHARGAWNPLLRTDAAGLAKRQALDDALALIGSQAGSGGAFHEALSRLDSKGLRGHLGASGLSWHANGIRIETSTGGQALPASLPELEEALGSKAPEWMSCQNAVERCLKALLELPKMPAPQAAACALCKNPGPLFAAQALSIRSGICAPWSWVDPSIKEWALMAADSLPADATERDILNHLREISRRESMPFGAAEAAASSLAAERFGLSDAPRQSPFAPARPKM